ncbi:hypothetical protein VPH46_11715, partial [Sphingomonas sp. MJ1 (PH-R8)]|uniref:hypothetical protein n=1 Tax=Sphingomonas sp. MJ1 (PH-R8) TaxID=3112950 RepID=UPI003A86EE75
RGLIESTVWKRPLADICALRRLASVQTFRVAQGGTGAKAQNWLADATTPIGRRTQQSGRLMQRSTSSSLKMMFYSIVCATGAWSPALPMPWRFIWVATSCISLVLLIRSIRRRPCHHGFINQRGAVFYPWVIDPCPKCGLSIDEQAATSRDDFDGNNR